MAKKAQEKEPEIILCSFCNSEINGNHEIVNTKRRTELHICKKCVEDTYRHIRQEDNPNETKNRNTTSVERNKS